MTISPPTNVKTGTAQDFQALASGIDSLYLSMDVLWQNQKLFLYLDDLKRAAKTSKKEEVGLLVSSDENIRWPFTIKPYGSGGYAWLLLSKDFVLKIGDWLRPNTRPSVMVEIRSETLWRDGPQRTIEKIICLLVDAGGSVKDIKPSRADLCLDLLMPESSWNKEILEYQVTRAQDISTYFKKQKLTGIGIGKKAISARLYDKPLEIQTQSKKFWMYDIWRLEGVPPGMKIIRVEFQIRREVLKQIEAETIWDLFENIQKIWAYCTQKWLKFQNRPGKHHTQRNTLPWWQMVQENFLGPQKGIPAIRAKAIKSDKESLMAQIAGLTQSYAALSQDEREESFWDNPKPEMVHWEIVQKINDDEKLGVSFNEKVSRKRAKYQRGNEKCLKALELREKQRFQEGEKTTINFEGME